MPLKKLALKPGVNRENTRYYNETGWYECDKVRFRQGTPEKIGGWVQFSADTFLGVCRSLWNWVTLAGQNLIGAGTSLKFYINQGGVFFDITPVRKVVRPMLGSGGTGNPFTVVNLSSTITVYDAAHGCNSNDFVIFSGATGINSTITALLLNREYQVQVVSLNTYTITAFGNTLSNGSGTGGGASVVATYLINVATEVQTPFTGWGGGAWGLGAWGTNKITGAPLQLWTQSNFGEDLIFAPIGGAIYYWNANVQLPGQTFTITIASPGILTFSDAHGLFVGEALQLVTTGALPTGLFPNVTYYVASTSFTSTTVTLALTFGGAAINTTGTQSGIHSLSVRGVLLSTLGGASAVPTVQNGIFVSDASRFVFAFGCNDYGSTVQDPMLIRWSDQESPTMWTPAATNQAGSSRLSHGSKIVSAIQTRQEIVVFTDASLYSLQYQGAPVVWSTQLLGDNISILGPNAVALGSGVVYWMGVDKFYYYDGRVQTLNCDLRKYVYQDINLSQNYQVFASTNEGFNEIWWFYCSANSTTIDKYVIYNYVEPNASGGKGVWYYGTMARTAWLDSGLQNYPIAATYGTGGAGKIVSHELGVDDEENATPLPINAYISSSEFDIDDGNRFGFIWRMLPDLTFSGSDPNVAAQVTLTLYPMQNSGSGTGTPVAANVDELTGAAYTVTEGFTGQVNTRVRGRQMIYKIQSTNLGTTWQHGATRLDIKPDGGR
jgi:hypothetical protein